MTKRQPSSRRFGQRPNRSKPIPIERFLVWRSRRRLGSVIAVTVVALLLILADRRGLLLYPGDDLQRYDGRAFLVVRVVDGDTLMVDQPDGQEPYTRVRLWGIDTPELQRRDPPKPAEAYAEEARDLARRLAEGKTVRLILEPHRLRGSHGRLLAHVQLPDGSWLNEHLLETGLARADGRWSHRHTQRYELLADRARESGVGLWSRRSVQ